MISVIILTYVPTAIKMEISPKGKHKLYWQMCVQITNNDNRMTSNRVILMHVMFVSQPNEVDTFPKLNIHDVMDTI